MPSITAREGMVIARDLAEVIGIDRSNLLKILKKQGIPTDRRRSVEARGQFVSVLSVGDAERLIRRREAESIVGPGQVVNVQAVQFTD